MMRVTALAAMVVTGLMASAGARAQPAAPPRLVVAELFTSEGCSSCPPADQLLTELARGRPDVLPLAFHVTYWDRLGWPDPFALRAATERQKAYAASLGLESIYTPQLVVDGTRDVVGSDRGEVLAALRAAAASAPPSLALRLARDGEAVTLDVGDAAGQGRQASVLLIGFDAAHRTSVNRGENAGRTLTETNVVRAVVNAGDWRGRRLTLHTPAPAGEHLAALVQAPDGHLLAVARLD